MMDLGPTVLDAVACAAAGVLAVATAATAPALIASSLVFHRRPAARHTLLLAALLTILASPAIATVAGALLPAPPAALIAPRVAAMDRPSTAPDASRSERDELWTDGPRRIDRGPDAVFEWPRASAVPVPEAGPVASTSSGRPIERPRPELSRRAAVVAGLAGWAAGSVVLSIRLVLGLGVARGLRRRSRPIADPRFDAAATIAARRIGLATPPPLRVCRVCAGPTVVGLLRPTVLVPEAMVADPTIAPARLADVLTHEFAHVRRRDAWVGLIQRLAGAACWVHPLVFAVNRRLDRAREELCDNAALRHADRREYARTLLDLTLESRDARGVAGVAVGLLGRRWRLEDRVAGILDDRRSLMTRPSRPTAIVALLTPFACGLLAAAVAWPAARRAAAQGPDLPAPTSTEAVPHDPSTVRISGVVVDESGSPVAGALVNLSRFRRTGPDVATAADGSFALDVDVWGGMDPTVVARTPDGRRQAIWRDGGSFLKPPRIDPLRLVLEPAHRLAVTVRDGDGRPVEGATIESSDRMTSLEIAETGGDGVVDLLIPAGADVRWVLALKSGVGFDAFLNETTRPGPVDAPPIPETLEFVLDGARAVLVRAEDSAGRPVAGVPLSPIEIAKPGFINTIHVSGSDAVVVETDGDGVARFDWIPTDLDGRLSFFGTRSFDRFDLTGQYSIDPRLDDSGILTVTALRNTIISGRVSFDEGRPAPGILIQAEGESNVSNGTWRFVLTGADGRYAVSVPTLQQYVVGVVDPDRAAPSHLGVVAMEGRPIDGIDFTLGEGAIIRGRVHLEADDEAAIGVHVRVTEQGDPLRLPPGDPDGHYAREDHATLVREATVDARGEYEMHVGSGLYEILPIHVEGRRPSPETVRVRDGETIERDFLVGPAVRQHEFAGTILGPDGAPIAGAIVTGAPRERDGLRGFEAIADADGRFDAHPFQTAFLLSARSPDGALVGYVDAEADGPDIILRLVPAATARGRVVAAEGMPVANMTVNYGWGTEPTRLNRGPFRGKARSDAEGWYAIEGLPVGAEVEVYAGNADGLSRGETFSVDRSGTIEVPEIVIEGEPRRDR